MGIKYYFDTYELKLSRVLGKRPNVKEKITYAMRGIKDYLIYGSSISDFFELRFPELSAEEKKTYITSRPYDKFADAFDTKENVQKHNSKYYEWKKLRHFMGREQLFSENCDSDSLAHFIQRCPVFMLKPDSSDCGKGIEKIDSSKYSLPELLARVKKEPAVIDELVIQHTEMSRICPGSVNTLRIVTAKIDKEVTIIAAALRMGSGTGIVDNFSAGGFVGAIDLVTGRILADGQDHTGKTYKAHPYTEVTFKGFQIPNWDKVISLVNAAALEYDVNLVGWDIAVRQDDAIVIEANVKPMIHAFQIAGNGGKREIFAELYKKKTGKRLSF